MMELMVLIIWLGSAVLCSYIAGQKNLPGWWFVLGFFFGIFAIIAVCAVPARKKIRRGQYSRSKNFDFLED